MARWAMAATGLIVLVGIGAIPAVDGEDSMQGATAIAYVNSDAILQQTPGFAEADSTFRAEFQVFEQEVLALRQTLDSAAAAFEQQRVILSPAAAEDKMNELQAMSQNAQVREQQLQARAQERQRELMAPLQDRIQTVLDGVRAERNLALIFDVANPQNAIVSADPTLDLTQLIITRVQGTGGQ
ncbi:MAG: OmpH family outer membrane protein [Gemmatimonadota bacterium]|nr:MAG: OmpH family outer membrane protein [Gemmatimonadota bacterium]